jgi:KaiC/GvpD/RAD55 family RecA-like ATPase
MSLRKRINKKSTRGSARPRLLPKAPTGIRGLDEITVGGLPKGRTTLVCGSAGCGKTMLAMEFIVRGAQQYGEPGVFVSFEESAEDLAQNVASMGFDLKALAARKKLLIDHVRVVRSELRKRATSTLKGYSSEWDWLLTPSARSVSCWTHWRRSSEASRTLGFFARKSDGCSNG